MGIIADNLERVKEDLAVAAQRAGRNSTEIKLMAVSKTKPIEYIKEAIAAGQVLFGENRILEAKEKFQNLTEPELHIIGHVQRNKAKHIPGLAVCVQSIDKTATAETLDRYAREKGVVLDILLEVNTSGEASKNGFQDEDILFRSIDEIAGFAGCRITGVMTIAPFISDETRIRKSFRSLYDLNGKIKSRFPELPMTEISMGMSGDYAIAVEEGSTMVRIGSAIFGGRG